MKKILSAALAGAAFLCAQITWSCVVADDMGHSVVLDHPAQRMVVLAPDLVEDLFAIGAGDRIVGVIQGSDYPLAARSIDLVGSYAGLDLEKIVALQPDLIVTWKYAFPRQISALRRLGFQVYVTSPRLLQDVPVLLRKFGCLTGKMKQAHARAEQFDHHIEMLRQQYQTHKLLKVFYLVDARAMITVNQDSWINQVIELCGGKNIFADARVISPEVSRESVILKNPDAIFYNSKNNDWQSSFKQWPVIAAVKNQQMYSIDPDLIARSGPRLVLGAELLCQKLERARTG